MSLGWALMEGNLRLKDMWDPIVEKFESYLCEQGSILGERITLLKANILNLSIYYLSLYKMPKVVGARMDRIRSNFL